MSWIPAFKIGLWNAWLLMLFYLLHPLIMAAIDKAVGSGDIFKKMGTDVPYTAAEKRDSLIVTAGIYLLTAYSIFLPLKLGTTWFYAGFPIYLAGVILFLTAIGVAATTPAGQPFTKGAYRFSRNPMYLSWITILAGVGIATASLIFLFGHGRAHGNVEFAGDRGRENLPAVLRGRIQGIPG